MHRIAAARCLTLLALFTTQVICAQAPATPSATLPPTTPTSLPASPEVPAPVSPLDISYTDGKLKVVAGGSSLNQVIHEISRLTSITVSGSASDEPVYGSYGPDAPGKVLASLLEDSGTNMLLRESTPARPGELILTRRDGTASPANPSSASVDPNPALPPRQSYERPPSYPSPPQPTSAQQPSSGPPAGRQSPEQIYQQLQRMQQAQPHP